MSDIKSRSQLVETGPNGHTLLIACRLCGVLLWDIDAHYDHAHRNVGRLVDQIDISARGLVDLTDEQIDLLAMNLDEGGVTVREGEE